MLTCTGVHLLNNAINFLVEQCGSSVVLCTATQPLLHQVDKEKGALRVGPNAEIIRDVPALFAGLQRHRIYDRRKQGGWAHLAVAALALEETARVGSCLVVVNTKREALSIFRECRSGVTGTQVFHLSTSMCPAHRLKILGEIRVCLDNKVSVVCVSTQLIEAGVDISFGAAIRALAGLDSIAQAAGRCNRHGEMDVGHVHVVNLAGMVPKTLKDIRAAQEATERVLDENRSGGTPPEIDLSDPKLIEQYFRYYFFNRQNEMAYRVSPAQAEREDNILNMLAENTLAVAGCVPRPSVSLRQAFMTASKAFQSIDANTRGVIVPYTDEGKSVITELCAGFEPDKQFRLLRSAQQFTVNVFPHVLEELQRVNAVHAVQEGTGVLYLESRWYSGDFGLNVEGTEGMDLEYA